MRHLFFLFLLFYCGLYAQKKDTVELSRVVELSRINDSVWVHTTYMKINGYDTPSNGLIVISSEGLLLIDTPWNDDQTGTLLSLLKKKFHKDVILAVITHFHDDRIGGISTLLKNNINTYSYVLTGILARQSGYQPPRAVYSTDTLLTAGHLTLEIFYPGEGHTKDNIVVWLPESKVLFGGCFLKSLSSSTIGNISDANLKEWPVSVKKLRVKFPDIQTAVPGHGPWADAGLIDHTLKLLNADK